MKKVLPGVLIIGLIVVGVGFYRGGQKSVESKGKLVMYKPSSCGCCVGHLAYLRGENYEVEVIETEDMESVKKEYGVPREMESCHTVIGDGYFIEGHVPVEAIEKLLVEKPDIEGIGLPGMPAGSPGMPGYKRGIFKILSLVKGEVKGWFEI